MIKVSRNPSFRFSPFTIMIGIDSRDNMELLKAVCRLTRDGLNFHERNHEQFGKVLGTTKEGQIMRFMGVDTKEITQIISDLETQCRYE